MLNDYTVTTRRTVSWGEMDAFQHVNNTRFFRFFEDIRIAFFEEAGLFVPEGHERDAWGGVGPILAHTSCDYLAPVTYPDELVLGARITETGTHKVIFEHAVYSTKLDKLAANGEAVVVSFSYAKGEKAPVPEAWLEAFDSLRATD